MRPGLFYILGLISFSFHAAAGDMGVYTPDSHPWSITAGLGYTVYEDMYRNDGQTALGRFGIAREIGKSPVLTWGLELGVQTGNVMQYYPSQEAIDALGGLPIQTTVKPMLDLLATAKSGYFSTIPAFAQMKAGIAYRQWQFNDRDSINNLSQIAAELQAGLGYALNDKTSLGLFYQGIFGANPDFQFNADTATGQVSNISVQNGVLLTFTMVI